MLTGDNTVNYYDFTNCVSHLWNSKASSLNLIESKESIISIIHRISFSPLVVTVGLLSGQYGTVRIL